MSLKLEKLSKRWEKFQIADVDLEVENGEYFVILGPTGAGKTLLLELIAGFHKPDAGHIYIDDVDVTHTPPEKRGVALVPQEYMLFPHMTVYQNVEFGLKMRRTPQQERRRLVREMLELLGIWHLRDRLPMTLSGGEKQKTALARALITEPKILLLDEPLSALDQPTKNKLREELKQTQRKLNTTTIHVTHDQIEARTLAERAAIMKDGKIIQTGKITEIMEKPADQFVAEFVGAENIFEGKIVEKTGQIAKIDIGGPIIEAITDKQGKCLVAIRPENIIVSTTRLKSSMRNNLKGKITKTVDTGALIRLKVDVEGKTFTALITKQSYKQLKLKEGKQVYIAFKASTIHTI